MIYQSTWNQNAGETSWFLAWTAGRAFIYCTEVRFNNFRFINSYLLQMHLDLWKLPKIFNQTVGHLQGSWRSNKSHPVWVWGSTHGHCMLFHNDPEKPDSTGSYTLRLLILFLIRILILIQILIQIQIQILRKLIVVRYKRSYVQCRRLLNYSKPTSAPPSEASVNIYLTLWIVKANNKIVSH